MPSLVYISQATAQYNERRQRIALSEYANNRNQENHLSGVLIYSNGVFMQMLEGPGEQLTETYSRILNDPRHHDVELLSFEEHADTMFDAWSMNVVEFKEPATETHARLAKVRQAFTANPLLHCADALEAFIAPQHA